MDGMGPRRAGDSIWNTERAQFGTPRLDSFWLKLEHKDGSIWNTFISCYSQTFRCWGRDKGVGTGWGQGGGVRGIRVGFGSRIVLKHSIDFTD